MAIGLISCIFPTKIRQWAYEVKHSWLSRTTISDVFGQKKSWFSHIALAWKKTIALLIEDILFYLLLDFFFCLGNTNMKLCWKNFPVRDTRTVRTPQNLEKLVRTGHVLLNKLVLVLVTGGWGDFWHVLYKWVPVWLATGLPTTRTWCGFPWFSMDFQTTWNLMWVPVIFNGLSNDLKLMWDPVIFNGLSNDLNLMWVPVIFNGLSNDLNLIWFPLQSPPPIMNQTELC